MPREILIQHRQGTAAEWTSANPILEAGEPAYETDTGKQKIGDGVTEWNSLSYSINLTFQQVTDNGYETDNDIKSKSLSIKNSTAGEFELTGREAVSIAVPTVRSKTDNEVTAFDVMPNGSPSEYSDNGFAWVDVLDADAKTGQPPIKAARVGIRSIGAEFGSRGFNGGGTLPVIITIDGTVAIQVNTDLSIVFEGGYGTGVNNEVSLSKTPSNYILRFATDGTILEEEDKTVKSDVSDEITGSNPINNMVSLTYDEYIAGTPVSTTLYVVLYKDVTGTYYNQMYLGDTLISEVVSNTTPPSPPTVGLIAEYQFEDNANDDENSYHGTATNITYNASGLVNKSAIFNGSTSYIEVPDNDIFTFIDGSGDLPFSVSFSFKMAVVGRCWIVSKAGTGNNIEWEVLNNTGNKLTFIIRDSNTGAYYLLSYTWSPVADTWYNVAATYDGSENSTGMKLYLDGVSVGTIATSGTYGGMNNTSNVVTIGRHSGLLNHYLNGEMDNLKIWGKELNQTEVDAENI